MLFLICIINYDGVIRSDRYNDEGRARGLPEPNF